MRFRETEGCACLFCGGNDRVQVVARDDGAAAFAVCSACREKIIAAWSSGALPETAEQAEQAKQVYGDGTKRVMAEAAAMTEEGSEVVAAHIDGLAAKGLIYPVAGKPGWYGADYPFADD